MDGSSSGTQDITDSLLTPYNKHSSIKSMTTTLFYKNTDLSADYTEITRRFTSNTFDCYDVMNSSVRIKHQLSNGIDCFYVQTMQYEYKGCYVGTQVNYCKYDNFDDAASCALLIGAE